MRRTSFITISICAGIAAACSGETTRGATGDVVENHASAARDGIYVAPDLTIAAAASVRRDSNFSATTDGASYAQPLYVEHGPQGAPTVYVATEKNSVFALNANTGGTLWKRTVAAPVSLSDLPCGNIDPLGITGTPVIDSNSRTIFFDAMTTPDQGTTKKHLVYALSIDDGSTRSGWPVDLSTVQVNGVGFTPATQNQRAALTILGGVVYVAFGGHFGDCGSYHGWIVGIPIAQPNSVRAFATRAVGGAIWAPGGIVSDGKSIFTVTGNTSGASSWSDGEALLRFDPTSLLLGKPADYFAPSNWQQLDQQDLDLGGANPILIDQAGSSPSQLALALGKDGNAYLMDRRRLGGVGGAIVKQPVSTSEIITVPSKISVSGSTFVFFKGSGVSCSNSGDLAALKIAPGSPPSLSVAWCATQNGMGSPVVSTTDGASNLVVWSVGAEGDNRLHGFDAKTGAVVFSGGNAGDVMAKVRRYQSPIIANNSIYVVGDNRLYRFIP